MNLDRQLQLLFSRLSWPSGLARERACDAIAHLLLDSRYHGVILEYLLRWIRAQKLESVVINGLLVILRAQMCSTSYEAIPAKILRENISCHSLLSWLLLREIGSGKESQLNLFLICSPDAPSNHNVGPFFKKYVTRFLPPIYYHWAQEIEKREGISFLHQWSYEWEQALQRIGRKASAELVDYWYSKKYDGEHYIAIDTEQSQIYRSSYLRTLAWAVKLQGLDLSTAILLASDACPIDLGLWKLAPTQKPSWWPKIEQPKEKTDFALDNIWLQVNELWEKQLRGTEFENGDLVIGQASGTVFQGDTVYELEICGAFQKCLGAKSPDPGEIIKWYRGEKNVQGNNVVETEIPVSIIFNGEIRNRSINDLFRDFSDWSILPVAGYTRVAPRWQPWRISREVWLPHPFLGTPPIEFDSKNQAIMIFDQEREISQWKDWTDGLGETQLEHIPESSGQYLLMSRKIIKDFAKGMEASFCWICRLIIYYRERNSEKLKPFSDYRVFGCSNIIHA